jgi:hypothetical protein
VIHGASQSQEFQFVTADIKSDDALNSVECIEHVNNGYADVVVFIFCVCFIHAIIAQ